MTKTGIKTSFFTLLLSVTCFINLNAQTMTNSNSPEISAKVVQSNPYPEAKVIFPDGVVGIPGICYDQPSGYRPLLLDLYLPPKSAGIHHKLFPVVIYVHGGAWMGGRRQLSGAFKSFPKVLASLAAEGYVVASIDYRLSGETTFPDNIYDVKNAIKWLRTNATTYQIDSSKIGIWGVSAGGHLAALAAVSGDNPKLEPQAKKTSGVNPDAYSTQLDPKASDKIQAAVCWYGIYDFSTIGDQAVKTKGLNQKDPGAAQWVMLGGDEATSTKNGKLKLSSPINYVNKSTPPMLLMAGDSDFIVPYYQTIEMGKKLKEAGVESNYQIFPGLNHSFIGPNPESTKETNLKALKETFEFFNHQLKD